MSEGNRAAAAPAAVRIAAGALRQFIQDVFTHAGMSAAHAASVADVLTWANLRGVDSHGVSRVPRYLEMIRAGDMNPTPVITVRSENAASIVLEADRAAGPVAMTMAMSAAVRKAKEASIALAWVRATTHTAALGYYTSAAAREGMAAIALAASPPMMAYHGAKAAGVSTSPLSIAVPGGDRGPLTFDMGTGIVSMGRLNQAKRTGQPIPEGWALDRAGNPTTDPKSVHVPLPMAGPKGSGLALMIECIASLIVSNPILAEAMEATPDGRRHRQNALAIAIDVARFCDPAQFRSEVERLVKAIKSLPPAADTPEVLIPGERGNRVFEQRSRDGVPIPRAIYAELAMVAERLGAAMPSSL